MLQIFGANESLALCTVQGLLGGGSGVRWGVQCPGRIEGAGERPQRRMVWGEAASAVFYCRNPSDFGIPGTMTTVREGNQGHDQNAARNRRTWSFLGNGVCCKDTGKQRREKSAPPPGQIRTHTARAGGLTGDAGDGAPGALILVLMRLAHVTGLLLDTSSLAFFLLLPDHELLMLRHGSHSASTGAGSIGALDHRWHRWGVGCWPLGQPVLRAVAVLAESHDGRHCVAGAFPKGGRAPERS